MLGKTTSKYHNFEDEQLLAQYRQSRDLELLGSLFQRYMHLVYGVCLKYLKEPEDSKDAVMQIFEKLIDKIADQEIRHFKSWLYVVTKNHCLLTLRNHRKRADAETSFMETSSILHLNGEADAIEEKEIIKAIDSLAEHQRRCIELFYFEKKSYQQIAEDTGYELKKVKSYIQNGKRKLKIFLKQHEGK